MKNNPSRIRIAVQKSGRLWEDSFSLLKRCGIHVSRYKDTLCCASDNFALDVLLVRDDDIPQFVLDGICDFGIVGQNVLTEHMLRTSTLLPTVQPLNFATCRLSIAVPEGFAWHSATSLEGLRIATTYPCTLQAFLETRQIDAEIITVSGSVEVTCRLGIADVICDLVSTGATLGSNQMREVETVASSQAVLIRTPHTLFPEKALAAHRFQERVQGAIAAQDSKYIMLHAPKAALSRIVALLPGAESPTMMPMAGAEDRMVVHTLCRESVFWETLESLKQAGASSILVVPVEKMML